jgi:hypothetical protein
MHFMVSVTTSIILLYFTGAQAFSQSHETVLNSTSLKQVAKRRMTTAEPLKNRLPFYHSSSELHEDLDKATSSCRGGATAVIEQYHADSVALDVVTIKSPQKGTGPKRKALLVFGEHARELVSSESGVHFVRSLCSLEAGSATQAQEVLAAVDFTVVPNANPMGRHLVESGNFCKRTNENGVDLNRNYGDEHRDLLSVSASNVGSYDDDDRKGGEENPGARGFSEPETQIIKSLAETLSPDLFISVHSGSFLLGMPYGFSDHDKPEHADQMAHMLGDISQRHFGGSVPYGGIARTIGYRSPGCSVDYAAEHLHVPFAFTFEIYAEKSSNRKFQPDVLDDTQANSYGFLKKGSLQHLSHPPISESASSQQPKAQSDESCLSEFNPMSEADLGNTLESWTSAYLDVAGQVAAAQKDTHVQVAAEHSQSPASGSHAETISEYMDMNHAREAVLTAAPDDSSSVDNEDSEPGTVPWDALHNTSDSDGWGVINRQLNAKRPL